MRRRRGYQEYRKLFSGTETFRNPQSQIFLTSRPELAIRLEFEAINGEYEDSVLHDMDEQATKDDLGVFFKYELFKTRHNYNETVPDDQWLPESWLDQTDLLSLIQMAGPLFNFAATVCQFVANCKGGTPDKKLQRVLEFRSMQSPSLTATYMPVLERLTMGLSQDEEQAMLCQFQQIVGTIVVLEDPLSTSALAQLLGVESEAILGVVDLLHSILHVPSSSLHQATRLFHVSFRDFLLNSTLRNPFRVDEKVVHGYLAAGCRRILQNSLTTDLCEVQHSGTLTSSIESTEVNKRFPSEVQYACRFWSHHIKKSEASITDKC
jgi:hypothetical protein